jgi:hypothetical protein
MPDDVAFEKIFRKKIKMMGECRCLRELSNFIHRKKTAGRMMRRSSLGGTCPSPVPSSPTEVHPIPGIGESGHFAGSDCLIFLAQQDKFAKTRAELQAKFIEK